MMLILSFNLILILFLFGCGGGGNNEGIPGNTGISDVGMKIYIASATHIISDGINEKESNYWMIDINKSICKYGENNEPVYENIYGSDFIKMNILSVPTDPLNSEIINKKLTITNYTVTFYPVDIYNIPIKSETYASQVILSSSYYERQSKKINEDDKANQVDNNKFGPYIPDVEGYTLKPVDNINNFLILGISSKQQLYDAIFVNETYSKKYLPYKYVMIITFSGQNESGKKFEFIYETTVELDDFKIFC